MYNMHAKVKKGSYVMRSTALFSSRSAPLPFLNGTYSTTFFVNIDEHIVRCVLLQKLRYWRK